jgi:hypothetical protein
MKAARRPTPFSGAPTLDGADEKACGLLGLVFDCREEFLGVVVDADALGDLDSVAYGRRAREALADLVWTCGAD